MANRDRQFGHSGPNPPVYPDPDDITTPPEILYEFDPTQPVTSLSPATAQAHWEEHRNAVLQLAGSPASDEDAQMATLMDQGIRPIRNPGFISGDPALAPAALAPVLANGASIVYTRQAMTFARLGRFCHATFDVEWTNTAPGESALVAQIVPPFQPATSDPVLNDFTGALNAAESEFGVFAPGPEQLWTLHIRLSSFPTIVVTKRQEIASPSVAFFVTLGDNELRRIVGSIWYEHNGVENYVIGPAT